MFVKKFPKWKIKRFFKRILKAVIFFGLFFCLTFNCFASENNKLNPEFPDFDSFVGRGGSVEYLCRNESSSIVKTGEFFADSFNLNDMSIAWQYSSSFTSVRLTIFDSENVQQNFTSGDSIVLSHNIIVDMSGAQVSDTYASLFTITVDYTDLDNDKLGSFEFRGDSVLKSHSYSNFSWGSRVFYGVELKSSLPSVNGKINSISYHFYNISPSTYSFRIYPSADSRDNITDSVYYYVGPTQSAPLYGPPDTTVKDNMVNAEDFVSDKADVDNSNSFLSDFFSSSKGIVFDGLIGASAVFNIFFGSIPWLSALCTFLLALGCVAFILNVVGTLVSRADRNVRNEARTDFYKSHKK